jgi:O-antigen chain-terminating methyltransferase
MTAEEADKLEQERQEADRRYNDALTALDRAIVSLDGREPARGDIGRIGTTLLGFLQQITAFVETKDRQLSAEAAARTDAVARSLGHVDELRTQTAVLRRAVESLISRAAPASGSSSPAADAGSHADPHAADGFAGTEAPASRAVDDYKYVGFEDQFRGSDAAIEARLRAYVPIFSGCSDVVDIGCGRGELLAALTAAGISARGVDANESMVAISRDRGLTAVRGDALAYVESLPAGSVGGMVSTQVVEHLEPPYLVRLLAAAARALRPAAPIVIETINPACWLAFFSSYIRDLTHVRPVHPETLQYLLRASGFERVELRYSAPVPDHMKMKTTDLPPSVLASADPVSAALVRVAHVVNANAVILNNLAFTHLDYAAVGYRM